jgi:S-DNA-T family DNA segregation ATPase FtsK/SpoIIIE
VLSALVGWPGVPGVSPPGGFMGRFISYHLTSLLAPVGTAIVLVLVGLASILVAADMSFYDFCVKIARGARLAAYWGVSAVVYLRRLSPWRASGARPALRTGSMRTTRPAPRIRLNNASPPEPGAAEPPAQEAAAKKPEPAAAKKDTPAGDKPAPSEDGPLVKVFEPEPKPRPKPKPPRKRPGDHPLPDVSLLEEPEAVDGVANEAYLRDKAAALERGLAQFGIEVQVVSIEGGPVITQYEIALAPGIKVGRVLALSDDIAMALKAPSVRIVAPIPGRSTVGVEVPNPEKAIVRLSELISHPAARRKGGELPLFIGKDASGEPLIADLAKMPHLLIAGQTGSGKSVCINAMITSILMKKTPDEAKLLLVDPKAVELGRFADIPHLLCPVVTDMKKAAGVLEWAENKMDERFPFLSRAGVRNISGYNNLKPDELKCRLGLDPGEEPDDVPFYMPHIVIVIDELADLMMTAAKEVESSITRLAQKARAVGIHIILATQRPSVDVITGLIKSNLPARISFQVASKVDSRTILDQNGADRLLGRGDMLFLAPGTSKLIRAQGTYVSDSEVDAITDFVRRHAKPDFNDYLVKMRGRTDDESVQGGVEFTPEADDLYNEAVRIVAEHQRGSVSLLQRRLGIGYGRAARLIDIMAANGIVGEYKGSQAREVLISLDEWQAVTAANSDPS